SQAVRRTGGDRVIQDGCGCSRSEKWHGRWPTALHAAALLLLLLRLSQSLYKATILLLACVLCTEREIRYADRKAHVSPTDTESREVLPLVPRGTSVAASPLGASLSAQDNL